MSLLITVNSHYSNYCFSPIFLGHRRSKETVSDGRETSNFLEGGTLLPDNLRLKVVYQKKFSTFFDDPESICFVRH